jgi:hypothetical protein
MEETQLIAGSTQISNIDPEKQDFRISDSVQSVPSIVIRNTSPWLGI